MNVDTPLDLLPGVPAYAAIRDFIRAEILSGRLAAGTRLTTGSLVQRFNLSQMPVREALQALEGEGLVTILPHRGATVLSLDAGRVANIYDLRTAIEVLLVRSSLPNMTNSTMAKLVALHEELAAAAERRDVHTVFELNLRFHDLLYFHADNPEARGIYDRFAKLLGTLRGRYGYSEARMFDMVEEHERILQALRNQELARLITLVRDHANGAKADLVASIRAKREC
ncbi:GntR family transcriptional regulator [Mesorhizobium sp. B2-2-4]|uniref:GntR family transcriptional regulator n=1 Tax=unclassified Mesorhizobium TaxID=325217 RepID=UPI00112ED709|nr:MULTISPECIES: GntR family transcriptional regulator [unclassified Mesorhizobium]MBZ9894366.1 GntR family transcriptional regulator [Mesorhizobium sp. BR1-1-6]TPM57675.1 GntR family transcriptional regulator [Mesorhizobium sp. B2-2-4]TPM65522.1 GntR family transcriptional regulator [Mesorhizobium sp. B2-2-1]TPM98497.1 GntR family transcriptional regulator [Mesorhizobium sp. B2-1-5]TPN71848.1 GntR family transcriptional regulator [Mesorhizobium sp. B1-1-3]